jgi:hypothetical protein
MMAPFLNALDSHYHEIGRLMLAVNSAAHFTAVNVDGANCGHPHGTICEATRCAMGQWGLDVCWDIISYDQSGRPFQTGDLGRAAKLIIREVGMDGFIKITDSHILDLIVMMGNQALKKASSPKEGRDLMDMAQLLKRKARIREYGEGTWQRSYAEWVHIEEIVERLLNQD